MGKKSLILPLVLIWIGNGGRIMSKVYICTKLVIISVLLSFNVFCFVKFLQLVNAAVTISEMLEKCVCK